MVVDGGLYHPNLQEGLGIDWHHFAGFKAKGVEFTTTIRFTNWKLIIF